MSDFITFHKGFCNSFLHCKVRNNLSESLPISIPFLLFSIRFNPVKIESQAIGKK